MPWTGLLIVLSSKSLTVTVDSSAAPAVPMMMLHGGELAGNATLNEQERYAWEREWGLGRDHIGRQAHIDRQVYRRCASSDNGGWLTPWEWCEEHAGFERQTSTNAGSPWLLGVLLTAVVLAYATAASTSDGGFGDCADRPEEMEGEEPAPRLPPDAPTMEDECDTAYEPRSPRVAMAAGLHASDRMVDLDGLAGRSTASAILDHVRGGGQAVTLPLKVYLATQWERGNQRVWRRLQHHIDSKDWILCTSETFTLFIRRAACPALLHLLPDFGEFVGPARGKQVGRVVFARRARGAIVTATLLAALAKVAVDELDETLGHVVYVTLADRLPLAGYALNEDGVSLLAPLGHLGERLLDYFGQHRDPATCLFFADVAAHVPLSSNEANDAWWPVHAKRSRADRITRPAVVNLGDSEIDQYNQHGLDGGWVKLRLSPRRRRELAEDAIDAHPVAARSELHKSRWHGAGIFWTGPVHLGCNRTARIATHWYHHTLYFTQAERVEQGLATEADLMNLSSDCLGVSYLAPHIAFQTPFASNNRQPPGRCEPPTSRLLVAGEGVHFLPPPAL
jgi:hypothetical protein